MTFVTLIHPHGIQGIYSNVLSAEITSVSSARGRLDDSVRRCTASHSSAPADRGLDMGRGHHRHRDRGPRRLLVATIPSRLLVRGGLI